MIFWYVKNLIACAANSCVALRLYVSLMSRVFYKAVLINFFTWKIVFRKAHDMAAGNAQRETSDAQRLKTVLIEDELKFFSIYIYQI